MSIMSGMNGKSTGNFGRALLFEHLPEIKFRHSNQGVLFIIFANGDAFFYPLNEQTKGNSPTSAKMLTNETSATRKLGPKDGSSIKFSAASIDSSSNSNNKYFVYDASLLLSAELYRVFTFQFLWDPVAHSPLPPRKVLLSPNRRLLLLLGAVHPAVRQSCLIVYQIVEEGAPEFRVIFYDLSFCFLDACFSPDSRSLLVIPAKYPHFIFMLGLPLINTSTTASSKATTSTTQRKPILGGLGLGGGSAPTASSSTSGSSSSNASSNSNTSSNSGGGQPLEYTGLSHSQKQKNINFEARRAGPLSIFGPARGICGQPLLMTHLAVNGNQTIRDGNDNFHLVTWNDEGLGEYCLWKLHIHPDTSRFEYFPRLTVPRAVNEKSEEEDGPKNYILDIQFSSREHKLMMVVKRDNYSRKGDNGIGLQMINLELICSHHQQQQHHHPSSSSISSSSSSVTSTTTSENTKDAPPPRLTDVYWYQVTEATDSKEAILCAKWTNTLLLGTTHSAAIIIKGKGLFELVDYQFGSAFQQLYDNFVQEVCNFIQVGRYHRFWLTSNGTLRVMVVQPQVPSPHPEWGEMSRTNRTDLLNMRHLGSRIGYFINAIDKDTRTIDHYRKVLKKEPTPESLSKTGNGNMERLCGLHLYRCWYCSRPLLKPLQCSKCRNVAYCSKNCQRSDWDAHSLKCS